MFPAGSGVLDGKFLMENAPMVARVRAVSPAIVDRFMEAVYNGAKNIKEAAEMAELPLPQARACVLIPKVVDEIAKLKIGQAKVNFLSSNFEALQEILDTDPDPKVRMQASEILHRQLGYEQHKPMVAIQQNFLEKGEYEQIIRTIHQSKRNTVE